MGDNGESALLVGSVSKAFRILEVFIGHRGPLGLTELARESGLNKSAAQRFVYTLEHLGYLSKDEGTRRYLPSAKLLELASAHVRSSNFIAIGTPYLLNLSKQTNENVSLTVLDGTDVIFVARYTSREVLHTDVVTGRRLPAYCTAPGRAILASLSPSAATDLLMQSDLRAHTASTIHTLESLEEALADTRAKGYAVSVGEMFRGDISVAAAIRDPSGVTLGAINIAVSDTRRNAEEAVELFAPLVTAAARAISGR